MKSLHDCSHACHVSPASSVTTFTEVPFGHRARNIGDHVVMAFCFVIEKIASFLPNRRDRPNIYLHNLNRYKRRFYVL